LLFKWGKENGEEDDSYKKGEVADSSGHHKRWNTNDTEEALARRELDYGLALYCVECGFGGEATLFGELEVDIEILPPSISVSKAQAGFNANMRAGLNLGMEAFVKYEKEWEKTLAKIPLGGFHVPLVITVGPFVSVGIEAKAGISATGTLLIGATAVWDDVDVLIDLKNSGNSHVTGLVPRFEHKAEATGELKIEASLGLPVKLGLGVEVLSVWEASAAIVDTPSIVAEGSFEVSASVSDEGTIEYDINGGCYGIAWNVHFENTLQAVVEADLIGSWEHDLIEPQESDPIAEGCIGYVNDGTDDDSAADNPLGTGSGTGATGNGLNSKGNGLSGSKGNSVGGSSSVISASSSSTANAVQRSGSAQSSSSSTRSSTSTSSTSTSAQSSTTTSSSSGTSSSNANKVASTTTTSNAASTPIKLASSSTTSTSIKSSATSSSSTSTKASTTSASSSASKVAANTPSTTSKPSSTTLASTTTSKITTSTTTTKPACTPSQVIPNPTSTAGTTCKQVVAQASVAATFFVGTPTTVNTVDLCATNCLSNKNCVSFSYNDNKACQLYNKAVKNVTVTTKRGEPQLTFYDKACWIYSTCPK
jgi:hypothetical protein